MTTGSAHAAISRARGVRACAAGLCALFLIAGPARAQTPAAAATAQASAPAAPTINALMQSGLDASYSRGAFEEAAGIFRRVLAEQPQHYGATYQLAYALERGGHPREARPLWESALRMAEGYGDRTTVRLVQAHLPGYPLVTIVTDAGTIRVRLDHPRAPFTVDNFLAYVSERHYDGLVFHRVVGGFMIQGGGELPDGSARPTHPPIDSEATNGLRNLRGTIAMARTDQDPHSADAQFYINLVDNGFLDQADTRAGYTVFGEVVEGMEVVDAIAKAPGNPQGRPARPVVIESIRLTR